MNDDNVVLFDLLARGGMARRGAPDKNGNSSAEAIALQCPSCSSELHLEAQLLEGQAEVLCGRCETEIPRVFLLRESGAG
ncbi:MAG TPA: hypothetical protein VGL03_09455 [Thermoanaerobaculia bacterium]